MNIVKYSNRLNMIGLKSMTKLDNDVFYVLLHKLQDQQEQSVNLTLTELKALIGQSRQRNDYIIKALLKMAEKFSQFRIKDDDKKNKTTRFFSIFEILEVPDAEPSIKAKLSKPFLHLINDLSQEYTLIDLAQYTSLRSKHSQTLYRHLKQWHSVGHLKIAMKDFRDFFNVPASYQQINIDKKILKVAVKELEDKKIFNFHRSEDYPDGYIKLKAETRGKKITYFVFNFDKYQKSNKKLQEVENKTLKSQAYYQSQANREKILDNQKAKQQIKQHNIAALAASCNALKVDEPIEEREDRIKKEVQRTNMSNIMKAYAGRWFTYNNTSYKIDNFEFNNAGKLVLFIRLEDNTPARYMHEFESINHFENYVKDYLI